MSNLSPKAMLDWAVRMFGPVALNTDERAARVLEEALELAQVENVPKEVSQKLLDRVYSRPKGETVQEIAGLQFCINTLAANYNINPVTEAEIEFMRVSQWPKEYWAKKHKEKIDAGVANLSPPGDPPPSFASVPWPPKLETKVNIPPTESREDE